MPELNTPLAVYKLLPKTNCGDCGLSGCMAFAAAVIKQEKQFPDCRHLAEDVVRELSGSVRRQVNLESIQQEQLKALQSELTELDLVDRAALLGGRMAGDSLVLSCLGKDFSVNGRAQVTSLCHTHAWFSIPFLEYVLHSGGIEVSGEWVPFRELAGGRKWSGLFEQRCEKPLRKLADAHPELFQDLISMFSGASASTAVNADVGVMLFPLPRVPMLICYWMPEEDMESKLHVFFDRSAEQNLPLDSLFTLGTGIAMMLEKIMLKHT